MMFNLDYWEIDTPCPKCGFYIFFFFKQACNNEIIICGGCKSNVKLIDYLDECKTGNKQIRRALKDFEKTIKNFGR